MQESNSKENCYENCYEIPDGNTSLLVETLREASKSTVPVTIHLHQDSIYSINRPDTLDDAFPYIPSGCSITIEGHGASIVRDKDRSSFFRFWTVSGSLFLNDVTLLRGHVRSGFAGAVKVASRGSLVMKRCHVRDCVSEGCAGIAGEAGAGGGGGQGTCGGAIFAIRADVELDDCRFIGNIAIGGCGGDAFPNKGRYFGKGGKGGGPYGGTGGDASIGQNLPSSILPRARNMSNDSMLFYSCSGGGGGASSGTVGFRGGDGSWGGGSGGQGAKTLGGFDDIRQNGNAGFGAGDGGASGSSSGSAGGGGGSFGGAICVFGDGIASKLIISNSEFIGNTCRGGKGGKHPWGWPAGRCGKGIGGALFSWQVPVFITRSSLMHNFANMELNHFDLDRVKESHLSQVMLKDPLVRLLSLKGLPLYLVDYILQDFLDW